TVPAASVMLARTASGAATRLNAATFMFLSLVSLWLGSDASLPRRQHRCRRVICLRQRSRRRSNAGHEVIWKRPTPADGRDGHHHSSHFARVSCSSSCRSGVLPSSSRGVVLRTVIDKKGA